jgi:hypothetical protein
VPPERRERIVTLALAHRLLTQFTSFVAVEERIVNEGGRQRTVTVPVEMPDGVEYAGVFGESAAEVAGAPVRAQALAAAPSSLSDRVGARQAPLGGFDARAKLARREAPAMPRAADAARVAEPAPPPPASPRAQTRLAPELLALATGSSATSPPSVRVENGRVRVAVTVATLGETERRALVAVGLAIERVDGATVVGWIAIEKLVALAELDGVERVTPERS